MRFKIILFIAIVALGAAFAAATMARDEKMDSDPISGEWDVSFFVQGRTTPATFVLKLDGNKVTGTANSAHTGPGTLRDGSWADNKLAFTIDFAKHESIAITGHLDHDKLVGEFTTEGFTAKWEAKKKTSSPATTITEPAGFASIAKPESIAAQSSREQPVKIPFELVNRHIVIKARVNDSAPLSFILDTGDKFAIINLDRARALNLTLQGRVNMAGAGANRSAGSFVKEATFTIPGLDGFSQPVSLALPLTAMASSLGQDFDGIIGSDFIEGFVVEVDYQTRTLTLHDKDEFNYSGQGEIVPIKLNGAGHPEIEAEVTPLGGSAVKGKFVVDMGSGLALALYSPFVRQRNLLNGLKTMPALGGRGAGGVVTGRLGRVAELKIGKYTIAQPITFFSEDQSGAFAIDSVLGNIGAQIMARFRVFLDYSRSRLIVEPNARFAEPFDRAFAGFNLLAEGADYRTFRVAQIQPDSPATEANLQQDDVLIAVDDKPASQMTLTTINQLFERAASFKLTVRRKDQTVSLTLTTRRMI